MSAPLLVEAQSSSSLLIEYTPPASLGTTMGGGLVEYELRYSRSRRALETSEGNESLLRVSSRGTAASTTEAGKEVILQRWRAPAHTAAPPPVLITKLVCGRRYYFQIRALSEYGAGIWSNMSEPFETLSAPPSKPPPVRLAPGADNPYSLALRMTLPEANGKPVKSCRLRYLGPNWKNRPRVTEWKDWGDPPLNHVEPDDCDVVQPATMWQFTVPALQAGAEYRFIFCCTNEMGESEWSDDSGPILTQPSVPDPSMPPFIAVEEDLTDSAITLTWEPPFDNGSPIERYTLQWASNPRFNSCKIIEGISEATYTLEGLSPNQWYYYKVLAWNGVGQGKYSEVEAKKSGGGKGCCCTLAREPTAPRNIKVRAVDKVPGAVMLQWDKPIDDGGSMVTRYKIAISLTPDFEVFTEVVQKACRECKITDIKPDQVYYFDISAANSVGYGPRSDEPAQCRTNPVPPQKFIAPARPKRPNAKVLEYDHFSKAQIEVMWNCPERYDPKKGFLYDPDTQTHMILHYTIQIRGGMPTPEEAEQVQDSEHFIQVRDKRHVPKDSLNVVTFSGLIPGRYYHAMVQAFSEAGASGWSLASATVRAPPGVPDPADTLKLHSSTATSIMVEWACPQGNGEEVHRFFLRYRVDSILRGWKDGAPDPPDRSSRMAGRYEEFDCEWTSQEEQLLTECSMPGMAEADSPAASGAGAMGQICRWGVQSLQPASFYTVEIISMNDVGKSKAFLSDSFRSRGTIPGPSGHAVGKPSEATPSSVSFSWLAPTYHGGEDLEAYEICWMALQFGLPFQADLDTILRPDTCRQRTKVDSRTTRFVAEGLRPGDTVLPVVRAVNREGPGPWCRLTLEAEAPSLTSLPDLPAVVEELPFITKEASVDHRPYSLTAHWVCPYLNGKWINHFTLHFFPVMRGEVACDEKLAIEVILHPNRGANRWLQGDHISYPLVHTFLTPGVDYVLKVRASTAMGDAPGWGPHSEPERAPPDIPSKPTPPTSMWQWPYAIQVDWIEPWMKGAPLEECAVRYSVSVDLSSPGSVSKEACDKGLETKVVIADGLEAGTMYYFQVCVKNSVGWSEWSDPSMGYSTSACRPAQPEMPTLIGTTHQTISVEWMAPDSHGATIEDYTILLVDFERCRIFESALQEFDQRVQKEILGVIDENGDGDVSLEELKEAMLDPEIQAAVAKVREDNDTRFDEELQPRARQVLQAEAFTNRLVPLHTFHALRGGIEFAVSVRARNSEGFSDWSVPLTGIRTNCAPPEQCPPLVLLEATQSTLRCEFRLPYCNGEPVTKMEFYWLRVIGPMERHLALGGHIETGKSGHGKEEGTMVMSLPDPGPEPAPFDGFGGSGEGTIVGLEPGTEYDVQVRAGNCLGFGMYSQKVRMLCLPGKPDKPLRMRHANKTSGALPPNAASVAVASSQARALPQNNILNGERVQMPVLPTVFYSHTSRLVETEAIRIAAEDRPVQARHPAPPPRSAHGPGPLEPPVDREQD